MASKLESLRQQLREVARDLDNMSPKMAGTEWHTDRVNEAEWLVKTIARYEAAQQ